MPHYASDDRGGTVSAVLVDSFVPARPVATGRQTVDGAAICRYCASDIGVGVGGGLDFVPDLTETEKASGRRM